MQSFNTLETYPQIRRRTIQIDTWESSKKQDRHRDQQIHDRRPAYAFRLGQTIDMVTLTKRAMPDAAVCMAIPIEKTKVAKMIPWKSFE